MKNHDSSNQGKYRILDKLFALQRHGIKPGLDRTLYLLQSAGNPHAAYPSVHVAGTNGKGAVCSAIASVLTEAGYKTGLYTSPHILDFNERIRINGEKISDDDIIRLADCFMHDSEETGATFFEITTAMAFKYFADNEADVVILETGMGGRFDSTNVAVPVVSVITSVSIDHTEYLGSTLDEISNEKAGIIKPDVDVVLAHNSDIVSVIVCGRAEEVDSNVLKPDDYVGIGNIKYNSNLTTEVELIFSGERLSNIQFPLSGRHQVRNLQTALTALHSIKRHFDFSIADIRSGIANIRNNTGYSSRAELIREDPPVVIDVGHNRSAVQSAIDTLAAHGYGNIKWQIVFGAMSDKHVGEMLRLLQPICSELIATRPESSRAMDAGRIAELAEQAEIDNISLIENVGSAIEYAFGASMPVLIIGSFYLAEQAYRFINKSGQ